MRSFAVLACLLLCLLGLSEAQRVPFYCNPASPGFAADNSAQLGAIGVNPLTDIWYQNITVEAFVPGVGYIVVANYGYWQRRLYNPQSCSFEEVQLWYRDANTVAIQQINSRIVRNQFLVPASGAGPEAAPKANQVEWVTPVTFDSVGLSSNDVNIVSTQQASDSIYITFNQFGTDKQIFDEVLRVIVPQQQRFYSAVYSLFPGQLPIKSWFDSFVVPGVAVPSLISGALAAFDADEVPLLPDPAAVAAGVPLPPVFLYTQSVSARGAAADPYAPREFITFHDAVNRALEHISA